MHIEQPIVNRFRYPGASTDKENTSDRSSKSEDFSTLTDKLLNRQTLWTYITFDLEGVQGCLVVHSAQDGALYLRAKP